MSSNKRPAHIKRGYQVYFEQFGKTQIKMSDQRWSLVATGKRPCAAALRRIGLYACLRQPMQPLPPIWCPIHQQRTQILRRRPPPISSRAIQRRHLVIQNGEIVN